MARRNVTSLVHPGSRDKALQLVRSINMFPRRFFPAGNAPGISAHPASAVPSIRN
jgi:hypothetical protein